VTTVRHWNQHADSTFKAEPGHRLEENRYWGIRSVLERMDGRLAREEYYTRLSNTLARAQRGV
jgi:hypothetical protein